MTVRWTPTSLRDLQSLYDFIEQDKPNAASKMVDKILTGTDLLPQNPHLGRTGRVPDTRELIASPFAVVYRVRRNTIEILAIIHSARRWPASFDS